MQTQFWSRQAEAKDELDLNGLVPEGQAVQQEPIAPDNAAPAATAPPATPQAPAGEAPDQQAAPDGQDPAQGQPAQPPQKHQVSQEDPRYLRQLYETLLPLLNLPAQLTQSVQKKGKPTAMSNPARDGIKYHQNGDGSFQGYFVVPIKKTIEGDETSPQEQNGLYEQNAATRQA